MIDTYAVFRIEKVENIIEKNLSVSDALRLMEAAPTNVNYGIVKHPLPKNDIPRVIDYPQYMFKDITLV